MAGIPCFAPLPSSVQPRARTGRIHGFRCCSGTPDHYQKTKPTPRLLKVAVSGVTELLRFFSSGGNRLDSGSNKQLDEPPISGIGDILTALKLDYQNAYFVTGTFTSGIYEEDCTFEDPTISFRGKELYSRNLKLLVPFFDTPSIELQKIEKGTDCEKDFVMATWKLRTHLKLPWRPLVSINGSTVYDLNENFKIIRHAESWDVSALEAVGQIFTPSFGRSGE